MAKESLGLEAARADGAVASPDGRPQPDFDQVYRDYAGFVFRTLRGMGVPDAQADDALQEVFIVVHRRLPEFDGSARLSTWLFEIALRVAASQRRKQRRARDHTPVRDSLTSRASSPLEEVEAREEVARLQETLERLDDDKRAVLVLTEIEELTAPEIAAITGATLNTVYTRLRRARAAFESLWQKRSKP